MNGPRDQRVDSHDLNPIKAARKRGATREGKSAEASSLVIGREHVDGGVGGSVARVGRTYAGRGRLERGGGDDVVAWYMSEVPGEINPLNPFRKRL